MVLEYLSTFTPKITQFGQEWSPRARNLLPVTVRLLAGSTWVNMLWDGMVLCSVWCRAKAAKATFFEYKSHQELS